jgi:hypothetical protein
MATFRAHGWPKFTILVDGIDNIVVFEKKLCVMLILWCLKNVKIVYDFGDAIINMMDKECTSLFHWTQSLDMHAKQLIKPKLQD